MLGMAPAESGSTTPTVTVRGYAAVRAEPDEALLWVNLTALKNTSGAALSDVAARSNGLTDLLDALGVAQADRVTTGVTVGEEFDHTQTGRRFLGHRARSSVAVRLTDPEVVGRLITQATDKLAAQIDGPDWRIAPDNRVWLEAARQAAANGRRKAEAYADGVGARLGRLLELTEPGTAPIRVARAAYAAMAAPPPGDSMPVEAGEHEAAASIQVTFALELA